jgi:toxin-antitoxin system PIN domain toxin
MRFVDVNVLVYAHREDAVRHDEYRAWLDTARNGPEPLALSDQVLASFVRIVTHPRIYASPTDPVVALEFVEAVQFGPVARRVAPTKRTWPIFADLVRRTEARGNAIPDSWLAAQAIELGAIMVTADRGFARFPGLRVAHPLD